MNETHSDNKKLAARLDIMPMAVSLALILALCLAFFLAPEQSKHVLDSVRFFIGEEFGVYYLAVGLGIFLLSLYLAFSPFGTIRLGAPGEKPQYSAFSWGAMMFTSGLAADILFYSLCEWILYANDPHMAEMGSIQDWSSVYPLFHWGPIPWSFYVVLACAFGFMLHVRKCRKQKYSEACRPILGSLTDKAPGRLIDLLAVFALLAGTATTFSLATPLHEPDGCQPAPRGKLQMDYHWNFDRYLYCIHILCRPRHEGRHEAGLLLRVSLFCSAGLCVPGRRRDPLHCGNRFFGSRNPDSEFLYSGYLYGSSKNHLLPSDLDHVLLGLLDGVGGGRSILYWKYL